jgi:hypothetical protein
MQEKKETKNAFDINAEDEDSISRCQQLAGKVTSCIAILFYHQYNNISRCN